MTGSVLSVPAAGHRYTPKSTIGQHVQVQGVTCSPVTTTARRHRRLPQTPIPSVLCHAGMHRDEVFCCGRPPARPRMVSGAEPLGLARTNSAQLIRPFTGMPWSVVFHAKWHLLLSLNGTLTLSLLLRKTLTWEYGLARLDGLGRSFKYGAMQREIVPNNSNSYSPGRQADGYQRLRRHQPDLITAARLTLVIGIQQCHVPCEISAR